MAITEGSRHRMHQRLEGLMGDEDAATLMEHLPPVGWADVATKDDLGHLQVAMKADVAHLRSELKADMAELRSELKGDVAHLRSALKADVADLRSELKADVAEVKGDVAQLHTVMTLQFATTATKAEVGSLRTEMHKVVRTHTLFLVGTNLTMAGLLAAIFAR